MPLRLALAPLMAALALAHPDPARAAPATSDSTPAGPRRWSPVEKEARAFLESLTGLYRPVVTVAAEAGWSADVDGTAERNGERVGAERAAAALVGARPVIDQARRLLGQEKRLTPQTARMLRRLLSLAAERPGTMPALVAERSAIEARQASILQGHPFCLQPGGGGRPCPRPVTGAQIDALLRTSPDLTARAEAWNASKEIGRPLRPGLETLVRQRNQIAREMGHSSFFALQVADYGLSVKEMMALLDGTLQAIAPLYQGLSCWARHTLAARYRQPVPGRLPAHWLGNRWAQTWPGLVDDASQEALFARRSPEWMVKSADEFYVALGFPRLPDSFWKLSDLYPPPAGSTRRKNAGAAAWHIDGETDVRSLMNVTASQQWFGTAHHELGHIHYFLAYSRPEVPPLLRTGANRAFPEAVGELARLASQQAPYRRRLGLVSESDGSDPQHFLLSAAMDSIVFLPFAAGTMSHFEHDLYEAGLPADQWQGRWWEHVARYQGVEPPGPRPADVCDACTKSQLHDNPGRYYDYALATLIKFQLHDHICTKILKQDVRACDYLASPEVGRFLRGILALGATRDWRELIQEKTGEPLGPRALLEFFAPLGTELARRNQGRCP